MKLRDVAKVLGLEVGCSDSGCIWGNQGGMCTNGGCQCGGDHPRAREARLQMRALARVAQHLAAEVERMRPVVEAAQRGSGVYEALDAYEKAVKP